MLDRLLKFLESQPAEIRAMAVFFTFWLMAGILVLIGLAIVAAARPDLLGK